MFHRRGCARPGPRGGLVPVVRKRPLRRAAWLARLALDVELTPATA
jgi:hypothetical protein